MRVGFIVGGWGPMGHCLVTRNFRNALAKEFETFVFASQNFRPGNVLIQTKRGFWNIPNLTFGNFPYPQFGEHRQEVTQWIKKNRIDVLFFNEMFDWDFVSFCKEQVKKIVTYLDYFSEDWIPRLSIYDLVIVCTKQKEQVLKDLKNVIYIPWGLDTELFKPRKAEKSTFFHSAGWGGYNWRKNTPMVIDAFWDLRDEGFTYFLHSQINFFPEKTAEKISLLNKRKQLKVFIGSVEHPGLYEYGRIAVCPTKLEGLGLYIPEALACGLPVITTNASPMNEFVKNGYNGLLVDVVSTQRRQDYGGSYYFPEANVSFKHLKEQMIKLGKDEKLQKKMSKNARAFILQNHSFEKFQEELIKIFREI